MHKVYDELGLLLYDIWLVKPRGKLSHSVDTSRNSTLQGHVPGRLSHDSAIRHRTTWRVGQAGKKQNLCNHRLARTSAEYIPFRRGDSPTTRRIRVRGAIDVFHPMGIDGRFQSALITRQSQFPKYLGILGASTGDQSVCYLYIGHR